MSDFRNMRFLLHPCPVLQTTAALAAGLPIADPHNAPTGAGSPTERQSGPSLAGTTPAVQQAAAAVLQRPGAGSADTASASAAAASAPGDVAQPGPQAAGAGGQLQATGDAPFAMLLAPTPRAAVPVQAPAPTDTGGSTTETVSVVRVVLAVADRPPAVASAEQGVQTDHLALHTAAPPAQPVADAATSTEPVRMALANTADAATCAELMRTDQEVQTDGHPPSTPPAHTPAQAQGHVPPTTLPAALHQLSSAAQALQATASCEVAAAAGGAGSSEPSAVAARAAEAVPQQPDGQLVSACEKHLLRLLARGPAAGRMSRLASLAAGLVRVAKALGAAAGGQEPAAAAATGQGAGEAGAAAHVGTVMAWLRGDAVGAEALPALQLQTPVAPEQSVQEAPVGCAGTPGPGGVPVAARGERGEPSDQHVQSQGVGAAWTVPATRGGAEQSNGNVSGHRRSSARASLAEALDAAGAAGGLAERRPRRARDEPAEEPPSADKRRRRSSGGSGGVGEGEGSALQVNGAAAGAVGTEYGGGLLLPGGQAAHGRAMGEAAEAQRPAQSAGLSGCGPTLAGDGGRVDAPMSSPLDCLATAAASLSIMHGAANAAAAEPPSRHPVERSPSARAQTAAAPPTAAAAAASGTPGRGRAVADSPGQPGRDRPYMPPAPLHQQQHQQQQGRPQLQRHQQRLQEHRQQQGQNQQRQQEEPRLQEQRQQEPPSNGEVVDEQGRVWQLQDLQRVLEASLHERRQQEQLQQQERDHRSGLLQHEQLHSGQALHDAELELEARIRQQLLQPAQGRRPSGGLGSHGLGGTGRYSPSLEQQLTALQNLHQPQPQPQVRQHEDLSAPLDLSSVAYVSQQVPSLMLRPLATHTSAPAGPARVPLVPQQQLLQHESHPGAGSSRLQHHHHLQSDLLQQQQLLLCNGLALQQHGQDYGLAGYGVLDLQYHDHDHDELLGTAAFTHADPLSHVLPVGMQPGAAGGGQHYLQEGLQPAAWHLQPGQQASSMSMGPGLHGSPRQRQPQEALLREGRGLVAECLAAREGLSWGRR